MSELGIKARKDRGQAIVIIALGFVVLLAFSGLVVDVARVFLVRGQLRRAVDAGGLAAAGQFRLHATTDKIKNAATQIIISHGFYSALGASPTITATAVTSLTVQTCLDAAYAGNPNLHCDANPKRKFVQIDASASVPMIFLQLIGIPTVSVGAQSLGEAAAVDAVLVLDASEAQAYDPPSAQYYNGNAAQGCNPADVGLLNVNACIHACNLANGGLGGCHPFQEVKDASINFINNLYQNYDRIAVVNFNRNPTEVYALGTDLTQAINSISAMQIPDMGGNACSYLTSPDDLWKCTSSNIGDGLLKGSTEFAINKRQGSLWVMIVLGSGGADSTGGYATIFDSETADWGFCPPRFDSTYPPPPLPLGGSSKADPPPLCRSRYFSTWKLATHTPITTTGMVSLTFPPAFDAKDYAVMWGNYIGSAANEKGTAGMGVLLYTIGLGKKVVCVAGTYNKTTGACSQPWDWNYVDPDSGLPNGAEELLRYIAAVGDDGDPSSDPCIGAPSATQCGNYYFAPNSSGLNSIFLAIAGRIFTRLSG